eukprot:TRINITY_DN536_c0_g1_i1.p1 TRINITY_DN536_c0_g1~~TRINITY_DN536_c0_g1_i1.p1  ORF type:complete len:546 (+),score=105.76 TRINITY_DN536_c0_g1_i1:25-1662(+)
MRNTLILSLAALSWGSLVQIHAPSVIPKGWSQTDEETPSGSMFRVTVGIKRGNMRAINRILDSVSDPNGKEYLQYPSYDELGELATPKPEHTKTVKKWLSSSGVTAVRTHPHGDYVHFEASLSQLEKMANGKFMTYTNKEGRNIYRLTSGVRVPPDVAKAIDTFTGFHGFPLFASTPAVKSDGPAGNVDPAVFRNNYGVTPIPLSGMQNIQAIAQFQGQYVRDSDLAEFCFTYDGGVECQIAKYVGKNLDNPGIESMLDTEYITSLGKQQTWVYSYPNFDFCSDLTAFGSNVTGSAIYPYTISISYGSQKIDFCPSAVISRLSDDVTKMGTMGITVMIASGDDGSGGETMQGSNDGKLSPAFPASVPHAVAVGATYWVSGTSGEEEATTNFGSGGGFSFDFVAPTYQRQVIDVYLNIVPLPTLGFALNGRGSPDVSTLGNSFTVLVNGVAIAVGGTSASSPSFAALVTLLNEICLKEANRPLGFANPLFYRNPEMFTDITLGTNAIGDNSKAGWSCEPGWDAATGLGVPNFPVMVAVVEQACRGR